MNEDEFPEDNESEEIQFKLQEAQNEIIRLNLQLVKERNLQGMQICKLCSMTKIPESNFSPIGEYINKQLEKYKKEYEDDLLFQELEQKAEAEVKKEAKNNPSSTNYSSIKEISQNINSNGSITVSSDYSFTKKMITTPYVADENYGVKTENNKPKISDFKYASKNKESSIGIDFEKRKRTDFNLNMLDTYSKDRLVSIIKGLSE